MRDEFKFGQPAGGIMQMAYVVPDLQKAMELYTSRLGVGPWFVRGPFRPPAGRYRGQPTDISLTLGRTWAGHVMIELIEQHDERPSVYTETIDRRGYGFHHWAIATNDFDSDLARYLGLGYEVAFADERPTGGRIVYLDTTGDLAGMIELAEMTPEHEQDYYNMYIACRDWDGGDPIR